MARARLLLLLLISTLSPLASTQVDYLGYPYVIDNYSVTGKLNPDSSFEVREAIDVTFNEYRHGIFRRIPFEFDTGRGIVRKTVLDQITVRDAQGQDYKKKITREGAFIKIRIGDADVELPPGTKKTYVVSYRVQNAINWFGKDSDWEPFAELYWNLSGNDWDTVIRSFSYQIDFPMVNSARARVLAGYGGSTAANTLPSFGSNPADDQTLTSINLTRTSVTGQRNSALDPGEGVTIVLDLPEQSIAKPSAMAQAWWTLGSNSGFLIPILVFLILFPVWIVKGRDPVGKPCEVMFEPPEGMTASECGTLIDQKVDMRDISAGLITLAVKGYLVIEADKPGLLGSRNSTIVLTGKQPSDDLGEFETLLLTKLQAGGTNIEKSELTTLVGTDISSLQHVLYGCLVKRGYYLQAPNDSTTNGCLAGLGIAFLIGLLLHSMFSFGADETSYVLGGIMAFALIIGYSKIIPKRTQKGADMANQVKGFEAAMRGRRNYLEWVADKKIAEAKYEEYLPYAIAFGLVQQWSDTFKEVVTGSPSWYHAPYMMNSWSMNHFVSDLDSSTRSLGAAATTPPRTSSSSGSSGFSSGGGFSGGGFGGGGGGSW